MSNNTSSLKKSFESYYVEYYSQVYRYILKKISNAHDAEDMTMEVFSVCYEKFNLFDPAKASFQTWLYVIVNNRLKNFYRDKKVNADIDDYENEADETHNDIFEAMQLSYMRKHLAAALGELDEVSRKIVVYRYFKEKDSNEIAFILGLTSGNVRVKLNRALEKIRKYFDDNNIKWE